jgi:hypothetical protein
MVIAQVTRARSHTDDVEWSSEDGTRTEHDFLCRCVEAAIKAGATTINIPDTVGYSVPEEYFALREQGRRTRHRRSRQRQHDRARAQNMVGQTMRSAYWVNHDPSGLVEAGYGPATK